MSIIIVVISFSTMAQTPYIIPSQKEFPIMVSSPIPFGKPSTIEDIDGIIECNANTLIESVVFAEDLLKLMDGKNIKAIFSQGGLKSKDYLTYVRKYRVNKNIRAWLLRDEPYYFNWHNSEENYKIKDCVISPQDEAHMEDLRPLYNDVKKIDPIHSVYFNLAATHNPCFIGNFRSYNRYLSAFQKQFKPDLWSFDYYPITGSDDNWYCDYYNFYNWLNIFSKNSASTKRPFWYYCQSVACKYQDKPKFPTPTESMLRFEAFTALAFGAKGIAYWYYAQRKDPQDWKYVMMPINSKGEKTSVWYALKQVNSEIKKYSYVFLNTKLVKIFSSGESLNPIEHIKLPYGPLVILKSDDIGVHISHLKEGHNNYLVMVSRSVQSTQKITTKFDINKQIKLIGGATFSNRITKPGNTKYGKEIEWTIEPGGYIIFHFDDRKPLRNAL